MASLKQDQIVDLWDYRFLGRAEGQAVYWCSAQAVLLDPNAICWIYRISNSMASLRSSQESPFLSRPARLPASLPACNGIAESAFPELFNQITAGSAVTDASVPLLPACAASPLRLRCGATHYAHVNSLPACLH